MSGPSRQVVHIGLEVLDNAALVCRGKICPRMRELKRSHSGIVRLQNSLEVESETIPECELSAR